MPLMCPSSSTQRCTWVFQLEHSVPVGFQGLFIALQGPFTLALHLHSPGWLQVE